MRRTRTRRPREPQITSRAVMTRRPGRPHPRRDGGLVPHARRSAAVRHAAERLAHPLCQPADGGPRRRARVRACARERRAPEQPSGDGASRRARLRRVELTAGAAERPARPGRAPHRDSNRDRGHATAARRRGNGASAARCKRKSRSCKASSTSSTRGGISCNNMVDFAHETDANGSGVSTLKEHINAIAASIPAASGAMPELGAAEAQAGAAGTGGAAPPSTDRASRRAQVRHLGPRHQCAQAPEQARDDRRGRPPHGRASADVHADSRGARAADRHAVRARRCARSAAGGERRSRAQVRARRVRHDRVALSANVLDSRALDQGRRAARSVPQQSRQLARRYADAVSIGAEDARGPRGASAAAAGRRVRGRRAVEARRIQATCKRRGGAANCCSCAAS